MATRACMRKICACTCTHIDACVQRCAGAYLCVRTQAHAHACVCGTCKCDRGIDITMFQFSRDAFVLALSLCVLPGCPTSCIGPESKYANSSSSGISRHRWFSQIRQCDACVTSAACTLLWYKQSWYPPWIAVKRLVNFVLSIPSREKRSNRLMTASAMTTSALPPEA